ncbi:MAG: hypothetical protein CFE28_04310 [Alphaproteobacteria bacterium PA2]|nr:MAG: hypothetical protein CFE28_04310 [Alphaproteobacteria bacterium PA2]
MLDQTLAGARGAQDAFTFGLGDKVWAGGNAIGDAIQGKDLVRAYREREASERARDRYDEQHFRTARTAGQIAGTGAQILALGPAEGLIAAGARMTEAAPLIARELAVIGAAGGASGIGGQAFSDLQSRNLGSLGDYAGAAFGGTTGALAVRSGMGGRAGAIDGGVTSLAQDTFNRRLSAQSIDRAREAALVGGTLGALGGYAGRKWSSSQTIRDKGLLGEELSKLRSRARGQRIMTGDGARAPHDVPGGRTIPDHISTDRAGQRANVVEAKFGPTARLSTGQRAAYAGAVENYRVDHFLPQDLGAAFGLHMAQIGRSHRGREQTLPTAKPQPRRK